MFLDPSVLRCGHYNKDLQSMDVTVQWMRVDFKGIISNNCGVLFNRLEMILDNSVLLPLAG